METLLSNQAGLWMGLGFVLLAIEIVAFGLGSGVLLFGSIGAIVTGTLLWLGIVPNYFIAAVGCFVISSAAATAILWYPLKRMQTGTELGNDRSSDLIGHTFTLGGDINQSVHAKEKYSGISWRVEPSDELDSPAIKAGTPVKVTAVSVGVFFVQPIDM